MRSRGSGTFRSVAAPRAAGRCMSVAGRRAELTRAPVPAADGAAAQGADGKQLGEEDPRVCPGLDGTQRVGRAATGPRQSPPAAAHMPPHSGQGEPYVDPLLARRRAKKLAAGGKPPLTQEGFRYTGPSKKPCAPAHRLPRGPPAAVDLTQPRRRPARGRATCTGASRSGTWACSPPARGPRRLAPKGASSTMRRAGRRTRTRTMCARGLTKSLMSGASACSRAPPQHRNVVVSNPARQGTGPNCRPLSGGNFPALRGRYRNKGFSFRVRAPPTRPPPLWYCGSHCGPLGRAARRTRTQSTAARWPTSGPSAAASPLATPSTSGSTRRRPEASSTAATSGAFPRAPTGASASRASSAPSAAWPACPRSRSARRTPPRAGHKGAWPMWSGGWDRGAQSRDAPCSLHPQDSEQVPRVRPRQVRHVEDRAGDEVAAPPPRPPPQAGVRAAAWGSLWLSWP